MHTSTHTTSEHRAAGILLHPTSLPGRSGIGELGDELFRFLDWAAGAGMRLWQVLPLNPPGYGNSPYGCVSSFAGNPLLISLPSEDVPAFDDDHVEFERVAALKYQLLRDAWKRFEDDAALDAFIDEHREWLDDYALFMALKKNAGGAPWWDWDRKLVRREPAALKRAREKYADDVRFWQFVQFLFFRQWSAVREAAHARGIRIIGDVPIYVACDSADVWGHRELFAIDERGHPTFVAGVPPDYFSETGQRWGNPLYRWEAMREDGFRWWISRVRTNLRFADILRLDHFRGFVAYWEIPANEPTAVHGQWRPGPGIALFHAMRDALGELPLIAEDLGHITPDVHELRRATGLPGMRILQFGFAQNDSPHLPHRYEPHTVAYTGTHDNDTARGWYATASAEECEAASAYLGCDSDSVSQCLIRAAYTSVAKMAIVPAQDILDLGSEARMNRPGAGHGNWAWRLRPGALTREHAENLRRLAALTGRL
ncbi:MAG TPA: 4-alpha-glucanotransferase [Thermoanaerobaculia bacterium]|nr:4-alpha-glucanotransferase [Thermoanaerobaculia bacterium]